MSLLQPDRYFDRLSSVNIARDLTACGYTHVLLDVDNTLRSRADGYIPRDVRKWVARAKDAGVRIVLLSNSWHVSTLEYGRDLDLPVVMRALKPVPIGVIRSFALLNGRARHNDHYDGRGANRMLDKLDEKFAEEMGARGNTFASDTRDKVSAGNACAGGNFGTYVQRERATTKNTVVIGDQVFTDVLCAHVCGMSAYLVAPLSTVNIKSAAWQRALEGQILQNRSPEGACITKQDSMN